MTKKDRIDCFVQLGAYFENTNSTELESTLVHAFVQNRWFDEASVMKSIKGLAKMLNEKDLQVWSEQYQATSSPKKIGIVMAGNIPMVGFHDLMCVIVSGHIAMIKSSSDDTVLIDFIIEKLLEINPAFAEQIIKVDQLKGMDAVIATGSDNTARYFEYYFGKYPHIIRKNRTSVGVLTGNESDEELVRIGNDVFDYYGLGCRNVAKIFVPKGYDLKPLLDQWQIFDHLLDNNKYKNNYDYNKSILLVNGTPHLDTGFSLVQQSDQLVSPISVTYYEEFESQEDLKIKLKSIEDKTQCIVSSDANFTPIKPGKAQEPSVSDYADNVDTMQFLTEL